MIYLVYAIETKEGLITFEHMKEAEEAAALIQSEIILVSEDYYLKNDIKHVPHEFLQNRSC